LNIGKPSPEEVVLLFSSQSIEDADDAPASVERFLPLCVHAVVRRSKLRLDGFQTNALSARRRKITMPYPFGAFATRQPAAE
jgi:hypothetical protein